MCNKCENLKVTGTNVIVMKNGGLSKDPRGITSLELTRETKSMSSDIYLTVQEKTPGQASVIWMKSLEPVSYCPFCGEKL